MSTVICMLSSPLLALTTSQDWEDKLVCMQANDTCGSISAAAKLTVAQLQQLNPGLPCTNLTSLRSTSHACIRNSIVTPIASKPLCSRLTPLQPCHHAISMTYILYNSFILPFAQGPFCPGYSATLTCTHPQQHQTHINGLENTLHSGVIVPSRASLP